MKKLLVVMVVVFAVFIISIPQTSAQTIYACVNKMLGGVMRWVSGQGQCLKFETQISWNITGPPGPAGVGNLGVYDGNGLFLGYLFDQSKEGPGYVIFHPELQAFFTVVYAFQPYLVTDHIHYLYFTSGDCSGQLYILPDAGIQSDRGIQTLYAPAGNSNIFYVMDTQIPVVRMTDLKSFKILTTNGCQPVDYTEPDRAVYAGKQIPVPPLFNATIVHPIVVHPIQ